MKRAEEGDEIIVRIQELTGLGVEGARLDLAGPILELREVNGAEEPIDPAAAPLRSKTARSDARIAGGGLVASFGPYQMRTFALRLGRSPVRLARIEAEPLPLPYNRVGITAHGSTLSAGLDPDGRTLPGELLPGEMTIEGVLYRTGPRGDGQPNVVACLGQALAIPDGPFERIDILAARSGGDGEAVFRAGERPAPLWLQDFREPVARVDSRLTGAGFEEEPDRILPAYRKPARLGWVGTHLHTADGGREAYRFGQSSATGSNYRLAPAP